MPENLEEFVLKELRTARNEHGYEPRFSGLAQLEVLRNLGLVDAFITIFRSMYIGVLDPHAYFDGNGILRDTQTEEEIEPYSFFTERSNGGGWEVDVNTLNREKLRALLGAA